MQGSDTVEDSKFEFAVVAPAPDEFFYRDSQGDWKGLFEEAQMLAWYRCKFFTRDLIVRRKESKEEVKLCGCLVQ